MSAELIARMEAAAEGSMALSREVARAVGWVNRGNSKRGEWVHPDNIRGGVPVLDSLHGTEVHREPPDFTRSIDAAAALVPEGYQYDIHCYRSAGSVASVGGTRQVSSPIVATAPLALCIACMKVIASIGMPRETRVETNSGAPKIDTKESAASDGGDR
jgi:hypothetical protein